MVRPKLGYTALFYQFCRDVVATQKRAERLIDLANERGFLFWLAMGMMIQGWTRVEQGQIEEGLEQIQQGWHTWQIMGASSGLTYFATLRVDVYEKMGQVDKGLSLLTEMLATAETYDERYYEAELYRLRGELLLKAKGKRSNEKLSAEVSFLKAIDVARRQEAKLLELRAAMSLSRLWRQQGKQDEARQRLAEIYDWFTEGFETKDLKEARALLAELS